MTPLPVHSSTQPRREHPRLTGLLLMLSLLVFYVLSIGPVDRLVERQFLPMDVLYYERPLYAVADHVPALNRFLDFYVSDVWKVDQPSLR